MKIGQPGQQRQHKGFTLIEIIVGLVVLSFSFVILSVIIFPQAQRSAEPILQSRAAALGQALLDEIISKPFDENSDRVGGEFRCGEDDAPDCTPPALLGPESGETRDRFNDVDDYHNLHLNFPGLQDALGADLASRYPGFDFRVTVCYSNQIGVCQSEVTLYKRAEVVIITPLNQEFIFSSIRGNF